jgi:cytochrome c oxidase assembly protein subunit 11
MFGCITASELFIMNRIRGLLVKSRAYFAYRKPNRPWFNPQNSERKQQKSSYLHIGVYGAMFAACFAAIPLYRIFCEHIGLTGNNDKKSYEFKGKKST